VPSLFLILFALIDDEKWKKNIGYTVGVEGALLTIATTAMSPLLVDLQVRLGWLTFCVTSIVLTVVYFTPFVFERGAESRAVKFVQIKHRHAYLEGDFGKAKLDGWYWHVTVSYYENGSAQRCEVLVNSKCGNVKYARES
jgi:hypothetical protein